MKILVTGGAGFIGSHVVDLFINEGYEVVVVDDLSTGRESNLNPRARFYKMDIRDPRLVEVFEKERPDFVSHHAAQMDVRRSVADPLFDASVNVVGSINLLEAARSTGVKRIVYISSGGTAYGEPNYLPCDEAHPVQPICPYGVSKHTVEHYLEVNYVNYGIPYTVLRYPNVYGPRQDPHGEAGVVAIFIGKMVNGEQVTINGDGEQQRDFVYVTDCARGNLLGLNAPVGIYNLGMTKGTTVNEIYQALKKITGYALEEVHGPAKVGETRYIYLDATKAREKMGWEPTVSLEEGLTKTVEHYKAHEMERSA
ncbi:MAG: NAD-dependent epimerase/dehydratase family protein [Anaerolineae bacterium]|nr:NAD-dependent epimerase/dehydratase family protein [Anaerolineae bacterium]